MFYKRTNKYEVAGRLNNVIDIVVATNTVNSSGFIENTYTAIKTVRAEVLGLSSKEYFVNNNTNLKTIKKIRVRTTEDITTKTLIKYKEDIYKIEEIIDVNEQGLYLELICKNIKESE